MKLIISLLIFGFLTPLKIQTIKCANPHTCVITLNKTVGKDTPVYVKLASGRVVEFLVRKNTRDMSFESSEASQADAYSSASLTRPQ